jgi:hypothetical protein
VTDNPIVAAVAPGYEFTGPALELGGLMLDETDLSDVHIKIPLVFAADIKGDLSGMSEPGVEDDKI